jgi:hypothetical protein
MIVLTKYKIFGLVGLYNDAIAVVVTRCVTESEMMAIIAMVTILML